MLPFGSITSIVPLFVLAFAYIVFFGASALSKTKTADVDLKPAHIADFEMQDLKPDAPDFRDLSIDQDAAEPEKQILNFPVRNQSLPPGIQVKRSLTSCCKSCFSPRPPPCCFLQA